MRSVTHSDEFDAPAAAAWGLLVDWPGIASWMPDGYILGLRSEGQGVGAVRHLSTASGAEISERLDALDEAAGTIDLSILEPLPWGLRWYRARAILVPISQARCRLTWCGTFEADTWTAADNAARLLEKSYARLFLGLRRELAVRAARDAGDPARRFTSRR